MKSIQIKKANGETQAFSNNKIRESLNRIGVPHNIIDKILVQLTGQLRDGISTREIYRLIFSLLNQYDLPDSYRYSLKPALMNLGPSGYPFEKFIAKLLIRLGYTTQTQVILKGKCIEHEIDVIAVKNNLVNLIECKYHNHPGTKSHSKDVLYVQARFEDIQEAFPGKYHRFWLVTNTRATQKAIQYCRCRNLNLIAWRYPKSGGLEVMIDQARAYPITCLSFLSPSEIQRLFELEIILISDLVNLPEKQFSNLGLSSQAKNNLQKIRVS